MKKLIVILIMFTSVISPLFRGLFFDLEASAFLAVLALLSFIYFMIKLTNKEDIFYNKWLLIFGTLLIAAYCLAFITAVNPRKNLSILIQVTEYLVFSIVLYDYYQDKKEKLSLILMGPMVISAFISAIIGLEAITGAFRFLNDTLNGARVGGTLQYANTSAIYYMIAVIFSLTLMYLLDKPVYRVFLSGINGIIILAMLLTRSRGGYIVGFSAVLLYLIIQVKGYRLKTLGSFFCSAGPAFLIMQRVSKLTASQDAITLTKFLLITFIATILLAVIYEGVLLLILRAKIKLNLPKTFGLSVQILTVILIIVSVFLLRNKIIALIPDNIINRFVKYNMFENIRITFDIDALKLISKNWLFGVGAGGWEVLYYGVQDSYYISRAVHNHFLEVFVDSGILGFLSFTSIVIVSIYYMIREINKTEHVRKKIYLSGLFSGFAALVIHSTFDFDLSYVSIGLMFWIMIVLGTPESKHKIKLKSGLAAPFFILISTSLILVNSITAMAEYNAKKGLSFTEENNYSAARPYYEEALRLDPYNFKYSFELSKIYSVFSKRSINTEKADSWREVALNMAERSISQNPYLPENIRALIRLYYDSNMPFEALEYAEKLVSYQPYYSQNYALLARSYLEAAKYYLEIKTYDKAKDLLIKCVEIEPQIELKGSNVFYYYQQDASAILDSIGI